MYSQHAIHDPFDIRGRIEQLDKLWKARVGFLMPREYKRQRQQLMMLHGEDRMRELVVSVAAAINRGQISDLEEVGEYVNRVLANYARSIYYGPPRGYENLMYL